jgi:hypothetical protein
MSNDRSREGLIKFLDYMANKGLAPQNTVNARKTAAEKILGILSDEEAADVFTIDVSHLMTRFSNKMGQDYTPGSLATYQSRLKSALDDFDSYLKNPLGFRPSGQQRERAQKKPQGAASNSDTIVPPAPPQTYSSSRVAGPLDNLLPVPIRADLTIYVQGLPFDLKKAEANKIAAVIIAMSSE